MSDKTRAEFEEVFPLPSKCWWSEKSNAYCWAGFSVTRHPHDELWQVWLAAKEKYEPRWRPIETAPTDGTWILAVNAESNPGRQHVVRHSMGSSLLRPWKTGSGFLEWVAGLTHWMPLPSAPSTQGGGE